MIISIIFVKYVQCVAPPIFKGRIKAHVLFWESITNDLWVLDVISYCIQFLFTLCHTLKCHLRNNASAIHNEVFVYKAVVYLLSKGLIVIIIFY